MGKRKVLHEEYVAPSMLAFRTPWVATLDGGVVPAAYAVEHGLDGYPCYSYDMARSVARALAVSSRSADAVWLAWLEEVRDDLAAGRIPSAWKERERHLREDGYTREQVQAILRGEARERMRREARRGRARDRG